MKLFTVTLSVPVLAKDKKAADAASLVVSRELAGCFSRDVRSEVGAYSIPALNEVEMTVEEVGTLTDEDLDDRDAGETTGARNS